MERKGKRGKLIQIVLLVKRPSILNWEKGEKKKRKKEGRRVEVELGVEEI
jgi:hypothetical protein